MHSNKDNFDDILNSFVIDVEQTYQQEVTEPEVQAIDSEEYITSFQTHIDEASEQSILETQANQETQETKKPLPKKHSKVVTGIFFMVRYVTTSSIIFVILLVTSNYSAYFSLIHSYVFSDSMERNKESIISSVEAGSISLSDKEYEQKAQELDTKGRDQHSIKQLLAKSNQENVSLDIDITPYENRIVIPKIWKNIPLLDVKQQTVSGPSELEDIFMKDLEKWVIRYPGSAKPGDIGNTFIFGHSSNFPWAAWDYNDVFALLNELNPWDKIIVYYKQKKYIYEVGEKTVIKPGDISILKKENDNSGLSLMTCWPVGTTLDRLIVSASLVSQE